MKLYTGILIMIVVENRSAKTQSGHVMDRGLVGMVYSAQSQSASPAAIPFTATSDVSMKATTMYSTKVGGR